MSGHVLFLRTRPETREGTMHERDLVVLTHPVAAHGLEAGDIGTIVHVYQDGAAYEVEFVTAEGVAAFQRKRLRGVVARYRGLALVVEAHAVSAADLSLALPDGTMLDSVVAATDTGVWQSVRRTVSEITATTERLRGRVADAYERIATIDRELIRLHTWDGQPTYDAAARELRAINAAFAAAEEQANAERGERAATSEAPVASSAEVRASDTPLAAKLLALVKEERVGDGWAA